MACVFAPAGCSNYITDGDVRIDMRSIIIAKANRHAARVDKRFNNVRSRPQLCAIGSRSC